HRVLDGLDCLQLVTPDVFQAFVTGGRFLVQNGECALVGGDRFVDIVFVVGLDGLLVRFGRIVLLGIVVQQLPALTFLQHDHVVVIGHTRKFVVGETLLSQRIGSIFRRDLGVYGPLP